MVKTIQDEIAYYGKELDRLEWKIGMLRQLDAELDKAKLPEPRIVGPGSWMASWRNRNGRPVNLLLEDNGWQIDYYVGDKGFSFQNFSNAKSAVFWIKFQVLGDDDDIS